MHQGSIYMCTFLLLFEQARFPMLTKACLLFHEKGSNHRIHPLSHNVQANFFFPPVVRREGGIKFNRCNNS